MEGVLHPVLDGAVLTFIPIGPVVELEAQSGFPPYLLAAILEPSEAGTHSSSKAVLGLCN